MNEQIPAASQIVGAFGGIGSWIVSVADSSIDPRTSTTSATSRR